MRARWMWLGCAGVLLMLDAARLAAGGWVVITVADLPDHLVVGQPFTLTYAVRQHGMRLLGDLRGRIEARAADHSVQKAATSNSEIGYYSATLVFQHAGEWTVDVVSGFGGQLDRTRIRLSVIDRDAPAPTVSEAERGQRLFLAKGCITCHAHRAVTARTTSVGLALTAKRYEPDSLRQLLTRPSPADSFEPPQWRMPDLKLTDWEIRSLTAFINRTSTDSHRHPDQVIRR